MTELHDMTIGEADKLILSRKLSPVELTKALLAQIETFETQINAFITPTFELALQQARQAEKEIGSGRHRGPLHGIPFGLKDLYYTRGILTSGHSKVGARHVPSFDATTTAKLYDAGAVLLGKLATHEFAHGGPSFDLPWPPARNPWNTAHFTGGSSSGSAAAVAAGFMPFALGTDTGGSVRTPASYCGIVGMKPTYGLVSRYGVIPNSFSLDHCGPLTRGVEDCAIVLQAIAGHDPKDPASANVGIPDYRGALRRDLKGIRIGVLRHLWEEDLPAGRDLHQAMEDSLSVLSHLGAKLETTHVKPAQDYYDAKIIIVESEALAVQQKDLRDRPADYGAHYLGRAPVACLFQSLDYVRAQRQRRKLAEEMSALYENYDLLVTAGMGPAPRLDAHRHIGFWDKWQNASITSVFNMTGGPALMVCNGYAQSGLPLGMQIIGRPFDDATVLRAGYAYEQATIGQRRRPELVPGANRPDIAAGQHASQPSAIDADTRRLVEMLVARAGFKLPEFAIVQLCEAAPYAFAMARRIPVHEWEVEPANVFMFSELLRNLRPSTASAVSEAPLARPVENSTV